MRWKKGLSNWREVVLLIFIFVYLGLYISFNLPSTNVSAIVGCTYDGDCSDNTCSATYSDSCSGYDLTEYDGDCTPDSTTVSDSCSNTCEGGTCTDCSTDCSAPSTTTHKCAGECGCSSNYGDTCGTSTGACTTGTIACDGSCTGNTAPSTEDCSNGIDDDCDGYTDCSDSECSADDADKCCGDTWISDSSSFEAGNPNCCGDDSNEYPKSKGGIQSCCDLSSDCADGSGGCVTDNTCSGDEICDGGTWISHCGDGTINCGEACDTDELNGQTCRDFSWIGGILDCYSNCTFNESNCCNPASTPSSDIDLDIAGGAAHTNTPYIDLNVDNDHSGTSKCSYKNRAMSWTQWYSCGSCDNFYKSWHLRDSTEGKKEARVVENVDCHWDKDTIILDRIPPDITCTNCYDQLQSNLTFYPNATDPDAPGASTAGYPSGVDRVDICKDSSCSEIYCSDYSLTSNQGECTYSWSDDCRFIDQKKFWVRATDRAGNSQTVLGGSFSIKRNLGCTCASDLECLSGWCYGQPIRVCTLNLAPQIYFTFG